MTSLSLRDPTGPSQHSWLAGKSSTYFPLKRLVEAEHKRKAQAPFSRVVATIEIIGSGGASELVSSGDTHGFIALHKLSSSTNGLHPVVSVWKAHEREPAATCSVRTATMVTAGKYDATVKIWDLNRAPRQTSVAWQPLSQFNGHRTFISTCTQCPLTGLVASCSIDGLTHIHDPLQPATPVSTIAPSSKTPCTSVSFLAGAQTRVVMVCGDSVCVYDTRNPTKPTNQFGNVALQNKKFSRSALTKENRVRGPIGKTRGLKALSGAALAKVVKTTRPYYDKTTKCYRSAEQPHTENCVIHHAIPSIDGHKILTAASDNKIKLWDLRTESVLATFTGAEITAQKPPVLLHHEQGTIHVDSKNVLRGWVIWGDHVMPRGPMESGGEGRGCNGLFGRQVLREKTYHNVVSKHGDVLVGLKLGGDLCVLSAS